MLRMITGENCRHRAPLLHNMHAERKRLFVDMLGWRLKVVGDEERDEWDTPDAEYLVLEGDEPCEHLASLRLLRTDRCARSRACACRAGDARATASRRAISWRARSSTMR